MCGKPKLPVAHFAMPAQNGRMRPTYCVFLAGIATTAWLLTPISARAQGTTIYRCESAAGISLQSQPCPHGAKQTRRKIERPTDAPPPTPPAPTAVSAPQPTVPSAPLTADADIHGPNAPYPLWQCMRADGSTFDNRNGVPGKQWVLKPANADSENASEPAQITAIGKDPIVNHIESVTVEDVTTTHPTQPPPPPGAAPGAWVLDQCTRVEPAQACERYAARRDELRRQIYAAKPSERVKYAPEEQDLSKMLYAACGR